MTCVASLLISHSHQQADSLPKKKIVVVSFVGVLPIYVGPFQVEFH
jgi:hypothetical protein